MNQQKIKVLLTGKNGQLGQELLGLLSSSKFIVESIGRQECDLENLLQLEKIISTFRPNIIINAAAYTAVDRAEVEIEKAFAVNAHAVEIIATLAKTYDARLIHISTDFVFDGAKKTPYTPDDPTNPLGVYGKSKLEGEKHVLTIMQEQGVVIRTSWLYSVYGNNFVKTMLRLMSEKDQLNVVNDQLGSPTWAHDLAELIILIVLKPELYGLYHYSNTGVASWYDFAVAIQEEASHLGFLTKKIPIFPISSADYPSKVTRPAYSVLDATKICLDLPFVQNQWRVALKKMLGSFVVSKSKCNR